MADAVTLLHTAYLVEGQGGKEVTTNEWFDQIVAFLGGYLTKSLAGGASSVTLTDVVGGETSHMVYVFTGTLTATIEVLWPPVARMLVARNSTSGAFSLTLKTTIGSGVVIPQGETALLWCDGTDIISFGIVTAAASATAAGIVELATNAEAVTGADTARATTPANLTARLAAPGALGGTTPAAVTGTAITATTAFALPTVTVGTLPAATAGQLIFVSDETGGPTAAYADGTNWRRMADGAVVS